MGRVVGPAELDSAVTEAREAGQRVVVASGCFDLLHPGHLRYLREAKGLGGCLVVGVIGDAAVSLLKGPGRPLAGEADRAELVAALEPVDLVTVIDEPRAGELIRRLRPDFFVKAGDFDPGSLPEAPAAAEVGAQVHLVPYVPGYSTTELLARARSAS